MKIFKLIYQKLRVLESLEKMNKKPLYLDKNMKIVFKISIKINSLKMNFLNGVMIKIKISIMIKT